MISTLSKSISWAHVLVARAAEVSPAKSHVDLIDVSSFLVIRAGRSWRRPGTRRKNSTPLQSAEANLLCTTHLQSEESPGGSVRPLDGRVRNERRCPRLPRAGRGRSACSCRRRLSDACDRP